MADEVSRRTTVYLPASVTRPFEVYLNGVPQREGEDYDLVGDMLVFTKELAQEGKLGFWRWLSIFVGIAGTYRKDDSVDVVYESNGQRRVASRLPLVPAP